MSFNDEMKHRQKTTLGHNDKRFSHCIQQNMERT